MSPPHPVEVTYPAEACTSGLKTMYIRPDLACTLRVLEVSARVRLAPRFASSDYPERSTPRKIGVSFPRVGRPFPRRRRLDPLGSKAINTSADPAGPAIPISSSGDKMKCCQGCLTLAWGSVGGEAGSRWRRPEPRPNPGRNAWPSTHQGTSRGIPDTARAAQPRGLNSSPTAAGGRRNSVCTGRSPTRCWRAGLAENFKPPPRRPAARRQDAWLPCFTGAANTTPEWG